MFSEILKKIDKVGDRLITLIFIAFLIVGAYISYDMWYVYSRASPDNLSAYKPEDINKDSLKDISENVVAWITIDNTDIDYPVLQGEDNVEYLNKDPYGEYNLAGSIFLDSRNKADFSDSYNIVYGHHMANGYMFGALDYFKEEEYFNSHRTGTLYVGDEEYKLTVVGFARTEANDESIFDADTENEKTRIKEIREKAIYWDDNKKGNIVALTTCKEALTTGRTVLLCRISR